MSGNATIDGTLCWNTFTEEKFLPQHFVCPFEVSDFSKGGLNLTISTPLNETNNTFRYETVNGECYEFKLENEYGVNIGVLIGITNPSEDSMWDENDSNWSDADQNWNE